MLEAEGEADVSFELCAKTALGSTCDPRLKCVSITCLLVMSKEKLSHIYIKMYLSVLLALLVEKFTS